LTLTRKEQDKHEGTSNDNALQGAGRVDSTWEARCKVCFAGSMKISVVGGFIEGFEDMLGHMPLGFLRLRFIGHNHAELMHAQDVVNAGSWKMHGNIEQ
jgi:hypothetical protein